MIVDLIFNWPLNLLSCPLSNDFAPMLLGDDSLIKVIGVINLQDRGVMLDELKSCTGPMDDFISHHVGQKVHQC